MNKEQFNDFCESLRTSGLKDDQLMSMFIYGYENKKISLEDLEVMAKWLGYDLMEEFYVQHNLPIPDKNKNKNK